MTEREASPRPASSRPLAATAILALYLVGAVGMVALFVRASGELEAMRPLFAAAAVANAAIGIGGLCRARWARWLALGVHGLATVAALVGLVTLAAGAPRMGTSWTELAVKAGVHGLAVLLWSSAWMRRHSGP